MAHHEVPPSRELCSVELSQLWAPGWPGPPRLSLSPPPSPASRGWSLVTAQKATLEAPGRRRCFLRAGERSTQRASSDAPGQSGSRLLRCSSPPHPGPPTTALEGQPRATSQDPHALLPLFKFPDYCFLGARLKATMGLLFLPRQEGRPRDSGDTACSSS